MIFQPVIAPFLVILLVLPVLAAAVWMLVCSLPPRVVERAPATVVERAPAQPERDETPPPPGTRISPHAAPVGVVERAPAQPERDETPPPPGNRGPSRSTSTSAALWVLRILLVLACGLLLLRPGIPGGHVRTLAAATDVLIAVDTTASMVAEDWDGSDPRLQGVRADVRAIVSAYPGARFALITFDANAVLRLPLTTDSGALLSAVDVLQPEVTRQSKGSSIGIAHQLVAETLQNAQKASPDRARMVFYLGDGEQTVSSAPESFAAAKAFLSGGGVLGYGTAQGGPMRATTGALGGVGEYIQYQGTKALSRIDEKNLQQIAAELGVGYQHRTADAKATLPPAPTSTTAYRQDDPLTQPNDLSWIVALVIVALLCVEIARATTLILRMRHLSARPASPGGDS